jgi:concanavalin A-like lectin/glucanase superfamily protein
MPAWDTLRQGLVAEYCFAGSAADSSGRGRHGVVHGAELVVDRFGRPGHAYGFDGIDDYIEVAPPPTLSPEALSVSVWAKYAPRDFDGYTNCLVAQDDGNDEDQSRRVFQLSTEGGRIIWHRMIGARDPMCRRRVQPGVWCHVVAVHDRGMNRLYVDGTLCDSVAHRLWAHDSQPLHIGRKGTPEPYFFFKGHLDDIRLYDRALSESEIQQLLREGDWEPAARSAAFPAGDPISGHWGQQGVVFLDIRYDGARKVTGRIMAGRPSNMALISAGSFDRESGALRLEGTARDPRDGGPVTWSIEGMLDQDEISVLARFNDFQGNFVLTRRGAHPRLTRRSVRSQLGALAFRLRRLVAAGGLALLLSHPAVAQPNPGPADATTTVFDVFDGVGRLADRIEIPTGSHLIGFDSRWLYTVRVDADDFEHLRRFLLPR